MSLPALRVTFRIDDAPGAVGVRYWYRVHVMELDGSTDALRFEYAAGDASKTRYDFRVRNTNTGTNQDDFVAFQERAGAVHAGEHVFDVALDGSGLGGGDSDGPERLCVAVLVRRENDPWWLYRNVDYVYRRSFAAGETEVAARAIP